MGKWPLDRKSNMTQNNSGNAVEPIVKHFDRLESAKQLKWLLPLRKAGMASFTELGFPKLSDEDWRFTNVAPIAQLPFSPAREAVVNGAETKAIKESAFAKLSGHRLVFVNGFFTMKLS